MEAGEMEARTESFRRDMLKTLTPENYFDDYDSGDKGDGENNNDAKRVIPPVLFDLAKNLKCTNSHFEQANATIYSIVTIDFGRFTVTCEYSGHNDGCDSPAYTVRCGRAWEVSEEDPHFTKENLDEVFEPIKEHLPGVDVEMFRKFIVLLPRLVSITQNYVIKRLWVIGWCDAIGNDGLMEFDGGGAISESVIPQSK
eukprot:scaffold14403_cov352-Ochromonas_danica.AAC.1